METDVQWPKRRPTLGLWIFRAGLAGLVVLLCILGLLTLAPAAFAGQDWLMIWPFSVFASLGLMKFGWNMHVSQLNADRLVAIDLAKGGDGRSYHRMFWIVAGYGVVVMSLAIFGPRLFY